MKPPTSNAETQKKLNRNVQRIMHHGIIADYDIYGGDEAKWAKRDDPLYVDEGRIVMMICGFGCTVRTGAWDIALSYQRSSR